jgi:hypothetical protein
MTEIVEQTHEAPADIQVTVTSIWPGFLEIDPASSGSLLDRDSDSYKATMKLMIAGIKEQRASLGRMYRRAYDQLR